MTPALDTAGLDRLKQLFVDLSETPLPKPPDEEREILGWGRDGPLYSDAYAEIHRANMIRLALEQIADAQGDVDAFIAQKSDKARTVPEVAADIARRLLAAGRTDEAWQAVEAVNTDRPGWTPYEWEQVRLDVLDALGRAEEAQAFRLDCFESSLQAAHLRAYLERLPDFDDMEAEERALSIALGFTDVHQALNFLVFWPALDIAADLVLARADEINGNYYEILAPAADLLEARHPLATIVLRRTMIDFSLDKARTSRYRHAARHLLQCESLDPAVNDYGPLEPHNTYLARLQAEHGRKASFWNLFPESYDPMAGPVKKTPEGGLL